MNQKLNTLSDDVLYTDKELVTAYERGLEDGIRRACAEVYLLINKITKDKSTDCKMTPKI